MEVAAISHGMSSVLAGKKVDNHIIRTIRLRRVDNGKVAQRTHHLVMLIHIGGYVKMRTSCHRKRSLGYIQVVKVCLIQFRGNRSIYVLAKKGVKTDSAVKKRIP